MITCRRKRTRSANTCKPADACSSCWTPGVDLPNLTKMLADWGVTARNDLVIDENPVAQIFGTEPYMPLIVKYGTNPIVQPLNGRATLFPLSRSFEVGKDSKPGITATRLATLPPTVMA